MKFKGFDDWVEIFEGGEQTDSNGVKHDGDAMIETAVKTFTPSYHEPPVVAGHPQDNSPAFGWVSGLKEESGKLLAKFKDIVPEFAQAVEQGLFKKRSASFYPDGRLRHVGFLGAMPPAVKGLADLSFSDDDRAVVFEFSEVDSWTWDTIGGIFRKIRDYFIEKEGREKADAIIPDWDVEYLRNLATNNEGKEDTMKFADFLEAFKFWKKIEAGADPGTLEHIGTSPAGTAKKTFSEADIEQSKKEAVAEERKKAEAEFAEKSRKEAKTARDKEIAAWVDKSIKEGGLLPAWADSGLVSFMQGLDADAVIEFAEGKDKKSAQEWFKEFLEGFGKSAIFKEMATKQAAGGTAEFAEEKKAQELGESISAKVNPAS